MTEATEQGTSMALVQEVNRLLLAGEPGNISVDDHTGYVGYKPQFIVDAMNVVFGLGKWGFDELSSENENGLIVAKIKVWLPGVDFQPAAWGQGKVTRGDLGDARKSAQTDGIKKALSYFSVGNRAFQGLLPKKQEQASATPARQERTSRPPAANPAQEGQAPAVQNMARKAFERAKTRGINTKDAWDALVLATLGAQKPMSQWDLNDVSRINAELTRREKQPAAS